MIRYVLVVHGIGEQRKNETVLSVVNRFAEARTLDAGLPEAPSADVVTLGMATGQTGREQTGGPCRFEPPESQFVPWIEFDNVPADWRHAPHGPFLGEPARPGQRGVNLRFVDVHWADLLQEDFPVVGEDAVRWADSLRGRLERKGAPPAPASARPPYWARETLRLIRDTVVLGRRILAIRGWDEIDRLIFRDFLGDVQLYGEYAQTRGRAVRRFHKLMARIEACHDAAEPPRYTLLAHSLGTVMSFDALLYALADVRLRAGLANGQVSDIPFRGYLSDREAERLKGEGEKALSEPALAFLGTSWIDRVDAFVTLGSPIDKYLVLWWNNYKFLTSTAWMAKGPARPIPHFNYCDEQDPVGHNLDVATTTAAYRSVFRLVEDRVFNRYALPGVAHVNYWQDRDLFRWILFKAVDGTEPNSSSSGRSVPPPAWFDEGIYRKILAISYKVTPYSIVVLDFFTFTWAWYSKSWHATALAAVAFVVTCLVGRHLIDLTLWWRQILIAKDPALTPTPATLAGTGGDVVAAIRQAASRFAPAAGTGSGREEEVRERRKRLGAAFRGRLFSTRVIFLVLAALTSGLYLNAWSESVPWGRFAFIVAVAAATVAVWVRLFRSKDVAWNGGGDEDDDGGGGEDDASASEGRKRRSRAWRVDGRCLVENLGAVLAGWGGLLLLRRYADPVGLLYEKLRQGYLGLPATVQGYVPDVAFSVASFFIVCAVVFSYFHLRFVDLRDRIAHSRVALEGFAEYALGPEADTTAGGAPEK